MNTNENIKQTGPEPDPDMPCSICGAIPAEHDDQRCRQEYDGFDDADCSPAGPIG